jgi:hypothetical protein
MSPTKKESKKSYVQKARKNDRDSPTSRKSVDLLLNDQHSDNNEVNSNSSNENNLNAFSEEAEKKVVAASLDGEINPSEYSINLNDLNSNLKDSFNSKINFFRNKFIQSPYGENQKHSMRSRLSSNSENNTHSGMNNSSSLVINGDYTKTIDVNSYKRLTSKEINTQTTASSENNQFLLDNNDDDNDVLNEYLEKKNLNKKYKSSLSTPNTSALDNLSFSMSAANNIASNELNKNSDSILSQSLNLNKNQSSIKQVLFQQNSNKSLTNLS